MNVNSLCYKNFINQALKDNFSKALLEIEFEKWISKRIFRHIYCRILPFKPTMNQITLFLKSQKEVEVKFRLNHYFFKKRSVIK